MPSRAPARAPTRANSSRAATRFGTGGDVLEFTAAAWNGASSGGLFGFADRGDLVVLDGLFPVQHGAAQLSPVWVNSGSNSTLSASDNVLVYNPSGVTETSAQQLAAELHSSSGAIVLPGGGVVAPGQDVHMLVAYDASFIITHGLVHLFEPVVNIADVDLVNTSAVNQNSTANLNVFASDMVSLAGVSLSNLTSANIHFI